MVAVRRGTNKVLLDGEAVGAEAKKMMGKTPANITVVRPLKDGVIADFEITRAMIEYFIRKVHGRNRAVRPRLVIAIPAGVTGVEESAVKDAALRAGAREVHLIDEPKAACIGLRMPVSEPVASMVVDVGGGTTEVAVISLGDLVSSESCRVAGDEMTLAIIEYIRHTYNLAIGEPTAERIKIEIGSCAPLEEELTMVIKGRDLGAGLPRAVTIGSEEIREALKEPVAEIVETVRRALETTEPELASDLVDRGMVLTGGGAMLRGLDRVIARETGLAVRVADDPLSSVALGTGVVLEQLDVLRGILKSTEDEG